MQSSGLLCFSFSQDIPNWLQPFPTKEYESLLLEIKKGKIDDVMRSIIGRLGAGDNKKLKRQIRNFVRSFIVPDKKVITITITTFSFIKIIIVTMITGDEFALKVEN